MAENRIYITTPIYYVNDAPHIGHSYSTILADVLARYHRLFGDQVRFQTGADEHGQKVQQSAAARGVTPQQHCDEYSPRFQEMWEKLGISPDHLFIRTTSDSHKQAVQALLQKLHDQGDIYKDSYTGWYSVSDEMFITDTEVTEEGKEAGRIIEVSEENYFFRVNKYKDWLIDYLENQNPGFILPQTRRNEVLGMLRQPLSDLCISRPKSRLEWGIELPFDSDYVTYVWFDALVNYISGLGWPDSEDFQIWWPHSLHLIGKDILKPHGFFWPIMLHAAGIPLPKQILAHGWWTRGGHKESKTVTSELAAQAPVRHISELVEEYGVDPIRYFLIKEMTLGQDSDYSEELIVHRLNGDLANDLGNLVSRVTKLVKQYFDSKVPPLTDANAGAEVRKCAEELPAKVRGLIAEFRPNQAMETILELVRRTNGYVAECEPWAKAKSGDLTSAGDCLAVSTRALRYTAILLHPVLPRKVEEVLERIGCPIEKDTVSAGDLDWNLPAAGTQLHEGKPIFPRLDWDAIAKKIEASPQDQASAEEAGAETNLVTFDDFSKLDLRIAEVLEAEKVLKTDKLLRLQIRVGEENRQIVAGVAENYSPEEIVGKQIVIVANLQPAKIRGVESQGMLLAAREGKSLRLITVDGGNIPSGASVS